MRRLRIPLAAAAPIGAVTCYRLRQFTPEDELLLEVIGTRRLRECCHCPGPSAPGLP